MLLDEIGEMPAPTQAKLLRVLEDRKVRRLGSKVETPVDVRVLAATNKDPEQAVSSGQLRQDLYFRLNMCHVTLPPLRDHKEDIPLLVEYILRDINAKHGKNVRGVGAEVMDIFMSHTWPGNIRELRNVLERSAIMCEKDLISRSSLPGEFGKSTAKTTSDLGGVKFPIGNFTPPRSLVVLAVDLPNSPGRLEREIKSFSHIIAERSSTLRNSRILPGQVWLMKMSITSAPTPRTFFPCLALMSRRMYSTSSGISSL